MRTTYDGQGARILEVEGLKTGLDQSLCCKKCATASVTFKDNFNQQRGVSFSVIRDSLTLAPITTEGGGRYPWWNAPHEMKHGSLLTFFAHRCRTNWDLNFLVFPTLGICKSKINERH